MIHSYHRPSGASKLAARLRLAITYPQLGVTLRRRRSRTPDLNWGLSSLSPEPSELLNKPSAVRIATSKVQTFDAFKVAELPIPRYSRDLSTLQEELPEGRAIIARRDGLSGGRDMCLVLVGENPSFHVDFYVERLSCRREFRFHVFNGVVIHRQAKFVPTGFNGIARNWENGCFFTSEGLDRFASEGEIGKLDELAIQATQAIGLDFGAVDLLITKKGKPYLIEVNTAPGLRSDRTCQAYENVLKELYF